MRLIFRVAGCRPGRVVMRLLGASMLASMSRSGRLRAAVVLTLALRWLFMTRGVVVFACVTDLRTSGGHGPLVILLGCCLSVRVMVRMSRLPFGVTFLGRGTARLRPAVTYGMLCFRVW